MEIIGTKYQTYIEEELIVLRLNAIKNENKFIMSPVNDEKVKIVMSKKELDKCVMLVPDAVMHLMITEDSKSDTKDVYVCVDKTSDISNSKKGPALVLRQDIYSFTKNIIDNMQEVFVGECVIDATCPDERGVISLFEFDKILNKHSIALYVDDTLDTILEYIGNKKDVFEQQLLELHDNNKNPMVKGYCKTLKELLEFNNFMSQFRLLFNIVQIDIPIELDNNVLEDESIKLNKKQIKYLEDMLSKYISNITVLKYDKDIDVAKIVNKTHIMVSDKTERIYLITYIVDGSYPIDDDIAMAMKQNIHSI